MTFREMNLRVFQREPVPHVFFQPRFEPWVAWHQTRGVMPGRFRGMEVREIYDDVGAAMRYMQYYTGIEHPVTTRYSEATRHRVTREGRHQVTTWQTPHGELRGVEEWTVDGTWRTVEFPVKEQEDFRKLTWLCGHTEYAFDHDLFRVGDAFLGDRGEPQFWVPKSPYQALAQQWSTLQHLVYGLTDFPHVVEDTIRAIDASHDGLYADIVDAGLVRIINFGENLHAQLISPPYFDAYFMPYYEKRAGQLREAGIFTHIHIDGYWQPMLPYLSRLPFDGIEALTPEPQGDMTLEEIAQHLGDKILLDGIPAVLFMPTYSREQLMACVERLVELFAPRVILGVSDEVPEGQDEEAIERVSMVADWCRNRANGPT